VKDQKTVIDSLLRAKIEEALADPRPALSVDEVFAELRAYHLKRGEEAHFLNPEGHQDHKERP
jgi:antitoxin ParD1/3/4